MPNIKPISDLRNYTAVISEVAYGKRVYLTRNGHGQCAIIDMKEPHLGQNRSRRYRKHHLYRVRQSTKRSMRNH